MQRLFLSKILISQLLKICSFVIFFYFNCFKKKRNGMPITLTLCSQATSNLTWFLRLDSPPALIAVVPLSASLKSLSVHSWAHCIVSHFRFDMTFNVNIHVSAQIENSNNNVCKLVLKCVLYSVFKLFFEK